MRTLACRTFRRDRALGEHRRILGSCLARARTKASFASFASATGVACFGHARSTRDRSTHAATERVDPDRHRLAARVAAARIARGDAAATVRGRARGRAAANHLHRTPGTGRTQADRRAAGCSAAACDTHTTALRAAHGCTASGHDPAESSCSCRRAAAEGTALQLRRRVAGAARADANASARPAGAPIRIRHAAGSASQRLARLSYARRPQSTGCRQYRPGYRRRIDVPCCAEARSEWHCAKRAGSRAANQWPRVRSMRRHRAGHDRPQCQREGTRTGRGSP